MSDPTPPQTTAEAVSDILSPPAVSPPGRLAWVDLARAMVAAAIKTSAFTAVITAMTANANGIKNTVVAALACGAITYAVTLLRMWTAEPAKPSSPIIRL